MKQQSLYQANRQQLLMFAAAIFGSITAAVIVSTLIIMTLMRGEIANALSSNVQNSSPTSQVAGTCAAPAEETAPEAKATSTTNMHATTVAEPLMTKFYVPTSHNSFNSTNVNTTNTTNNVTNTEVNTKVTNIKDSFNDNSVNIEHKVIDSYNPVVIKDNEVNVNSNNNTAINSGNTHNDIDVTNIHHTTKNVNSHNVTNVASNNTVNSNNSFENHILSDNKAVVAPVVVLPANI